MSTNFIYQKKKALSKLYCDELIEYFEEQIKKGNICSGQVSEDSKPKVSRAHKNSIDYDFVMHLPTDPLHTTLETILNQNILEYGKRHTFLTKIDPYKIYPNANLQKYNPTGGYFTEHCEYGMNKLSRNRVLAWMFYLNDVTDKGGTRFPQQNITLKARAGDLYIWPSYFTHSHHGVASPTQVKYIATGWIDFFIDSEKKGCY